MTVRLISLVGFACCHGVGVNSAFIQYEREDSLSLLEHEDVAINIPLLLAPSPTKWVGVVSTAKRF